ncbi:MAG: methyltransferase domain-containing protein [Cyanobacteria bacterium]|nr:methyltransferase domain-containing protein [Cyanobacteriota bacterium]
MDFTVPNQSSDRIQDALYGFARSQMLFTAIDLDIFTMIHQGINSVELLVSHLELDARGVQIFLDGLVGIGFLEKKSNENTAGAESAPYQLPPDVEKYLVKDSVFYLGGMVNHCKGLYENWMLLTDVVKTGQPAGGAQILADVEAYFSELVKGLYVSNYPTAQQLAKTLGMGHDLKGLKILDVAGGSAVWSMAMIEADKTSHATVLDYPSVINVAKSYVTKHGLESHYSYFAGDLEEMEFPEAQFDLAVLGNICHAIGPSSVQKLFHNVSKTLLKGGRLVIVDFVPDDNRSRQGWPLLFGVNMLISTPDGNVFTAQQYQNWFEDAGLTLKTVTSLESEVTMIMAEKI